MIKWAHKVQKNIIGLCLALGLWAFGSVAMAQASPVAVVQQVSDQMLSQLQSHVAQLSSNSGVIDNIVETVLVPHVDVDRMSGMVVGRANWTQATAEQRANFVTQFKRLVINTYAAALASYDGDQVKVFPLRGSYANQKTVTVNSRIVRKSGQTIDISYNMVNVGGTWQVYDFSIEGVGLVQNYQSQFASALADGGLPNLINRLVTYNKRS